MTYFKHLSLPYPIPSPCFEKKLHLTKAERQKPRASQISKLRISISGSFSLVKPLPRERQTVLFFFLGDVVLAYTQDHFYLVLQMKTSVSPVL